ncbi:hypothetical protein FHR81_002695 [Actinoalloteichus hoggarensis]|uniref:Transcriptional regulator TetR C-terminal Proteobacteria type domain-containing protein n=1 Tax=Actinoalloteichus hoggarensis TaxID=1470176 RepID=A0A221VXR9_9PSEU|nr:hypothetical protein AHOG_03175 [Actinoalloteichus hoggarensis]MBB5921655.1 hypothetical protein [Actinoalloteichus hoggarensis]
MEILRERGLLTVPDARPAAHHFAGLLLWTPRNQTMFAVAALPVDEDELDRLVVAGSGAFLRSCQREDA